MNWPEANASPTPTASAYITDYIGKQWIAMEASVVEQVAGPIYVRKTRYCLAQ